MFETEYFLYLLVEAIKIIGTIKVPIGTNNWDVEKFKI